VGLIGLLVDKGTPSTGAVVILSLLFPSMNYMFMLGYICRYEEQSLAINLLRAPKPTPAQLSSSQLPGIVLWAFLVLQTFYYPILATYAEGWVHETSSGKRTMGVHPWEESAVETSGLTKIYQPTLGQKWFTRAKAKDVVAVSDLNLVARRGQISCLLGANGSGKTTTLEMIGGFRRPTSGSVHVSAGRGQLGESGRLRIVVGA
jgi:ABC-type glutathione transport system ATPase component